MNKLDVYDSKCPLSYYEFPFIYKGKTYESILFCYTHQRAESDGIMCIVERMYRNTYLKKLIINNELTGIDDKNIKNYLKILLCIQKIMRNPKYIFKGISEKELRDNEKIMQNIATPLRGQINTIYLKAAEKIKPYFIKWGISQSGISNIWATFSTAVGHYTSDRYTSYNKILTELTTGKFNDPYESSPSILLIRYLLMTNSYKTDLITWRWSKDKVITLEDIKTYENNKQLVKQDLSLFKKNIHEKELLDFKTQFQSCVLMYKTQDEMESQLKHFFPEDKQITTYINHFRDEYERETGIFHVDPFESKYTSMEYQISHKNKITFPNFSSTSLSEYTVRNYANQRLPPDKHNIDMKTGQVKNCCLLKIIIPKGFPCMYIEGRGEFEVLLPPCTTLKITRQSGGLNTKNIHYLTADYTTSKIDSPETMAMIVLYALKTYMVLSEEDKVIFKKMFPNHKKDIETKMKNEMCRIKSFQI